MIFSFADGVQDIQGHGNIRRFQAGTKGVRRLHGRPGKRVQRHRVLVVENKKYVNMCLSKINATTFYF